VRRKEPLRMHVPFAKKFLTPMVVMTIVNPEFKKMIAFDVNDMRGEPVLLSPFPPPFLFLSQKKTLTKKKHK